MMRNACAVWVGVCLAVTPAAAQGTGGDTIRAGRFDAGKMWAFEYAPTTYFTETYGFAADSAWFARARLAALRIPGCSAAFVSPHGLVATNHHCVRSRLTRVQRAGERLLDDGFRATTLAAERRIPDYYADQLIAARDVSDRIFAAVDRESSDSARDRARRAATGAIEQQLRAEYGTAGDSVVVTVVPLYHGGRYSAYVFRRFTDVRLVAAAELQMGFFGGDEDNYTYPRYDLDFAFLRVYAEDGTPYRTPDSFRWSTEGVEQGDAVFVIGNPGPTSRLLTVAQLEFQRDVELPGYVAYLTATLAAMDAYRQADPGAAEAFDIRNRMFSLSNRLKRTQGQLAALSDEAIFGRKRDAERQLRAAIGQRAALQAQYGDVLDRIAALQREKAGHAGAWQAFTQLTHSSQPSGLLRRLLAAHAYATAPRDSVDARRARLLAIATVPAALEQGVVAARFELLASALGADDPVTQAALGGRTPREAAAALVAASDLSDSARTAAALAHGGLRADDRGMQLAAVLAPRYAAWVEVTDRIELQERELASHLGRARFAVYGESIPPDATSSPRVTDGVVRPYAYNGTLAPWHTTFYGLYDRFASHGPGTSWDLPERWRTPPAGLDLATPLNFVSTADTYGGNSGSPAVTTRLALVGLNFDRNIEGLSRDFIYLPERGRNVMVDVRAILAALDHAYDLDRIARELTTGELFESEAAADASGGGR